MKAASSLVLSAGLAAVLGLAATLPANGIPEPPLVLVGKVTGSGGAPITSGTARISLGLEGGTPVVTQVSLGSFPAGNGDVYSYVATIPMESLVTGFATASAGTLALPTTPTKFTRSIAITAPAGSKTYSDVLTLGAGELRGGTLRYDVASVSGTGTPTPTPTATPSTTATPTPSTTFCTGDADHSGFVNLNDYRAVRDNFGRAGSAQGDANNDGFVNLNDYRAVRDNFGRACAATKDFDPSAYKLVSAAAGASLTLSSPVVTSAGFDVQVLLDASTTPTGVVSAFITYDPSVVSFTSGTINTTTFNSITFTTPISDDPTNGFVSFSAGANSDLTTSGITVATLHFAPTGFGRTQFGFSTTAPRVTELTDTGLTPVASNLAGSETLVLPDDGQPALGLTPATQTVASSSPLSVDVELYPNGTAAAGAGVFISFDTSKVSFTSGSVNTAVFDNSIFTGVPTETSPGVIGFSVASNSAQTASAKVRVATLVFQPIAAGTTTFAFMNTSPTQTIITNTSLDQIGTRAFDADATITLSATPTVTPTPIPTPTPSPIPTASPTPIPGADRVLSIPTTLAAAPGTEVEIQARIDSAAAISGYRLALNWDTTKATYVAGSATLQGTLGQGCFAPSVNTAISGQLIVSSACGTSLSGSGNLLRFRLLLANGLTNGSSFPITWNNSQTRLNDGLVGYTSTPGSITVNAPFVWGDVACPMDGVSGTLDVSAILNYDAGVITNFPCYTPQVGWPTYPVGGDVNSDGVLGVLDASQILRYDALLISRFAADLNGDGLGPDGPINLGSAKSLKSKAAPVALNLGDAVSNSDGTFEVPVVLADGNGLLGLRLAVSYDASAVEALVPPVSFADTAANGWQYSATSTAGHVSFSAAGSKELPSGESIVARLRFKAIKAGAGATSIVADPAGTRANDGAFPLVLKSSSVNFGPASSIPDWQLL